MPSRRWFLLCLLPLPACALISFRDAATAPIAGDLELLAPGSTCRVTLRPEQRSWTSSSQRIYEGTATNVTDDAVTLAATWKEGISNTEPPIASGLPFVDRMFKSSAAVEMAIEETVTITKTSIERVSPPEMVSATSEDVPAGQTLPTFAREGS